MANTDINEVDLAQVDHQQLTSFGNVDLVLGGPPCQDFSAVGKQQGYDHDRGSLISSFQKTVACLRPSAFLFENVPNMKSSKWIENFNTFRELLTFSGEYEVEDYLLNCADYGCATVRERIFILGLHRHTNLRPSCPEPTHSDQPTLFGGGLPHVTVNHALTGLRAPSLSKCSDSHFAPIHEPEIVARFQRLKPNERDQIRRRNRLDGDAPAYTLFAGGERGGTRSHIHPTEPRELTPRECARIHGFPDDFLFAGNKSQIAIQIANSVPIPIASAWGDHLAHLLDSSIDAPNVREAAS